MEVEAPGMRARNSESWEQRDGTQNTENKGMELHTLEQGEVIPNCKNKGMELKTPRTRWRISEY